MKCTTCKGTGKSKYGYNQPCYHCDGTGIIKPLTNDDWYRIVELIKRGGQDWFSL